MITKIGIDLGYANITLSNIVADIYREPSVVLMDKNTRRIISIGARAAMGEDGEERENGILVRWFNADRIRDYVRITIGSMEQLVELVDEISRLLEDV